MVIMVILVSVEITVNFNIKARTDELNKNKIDSSQGVKNETPRHG